MYKPNCKPKCKPKSLIFVSFAVFILGSSTRAQQRSEEPWDELAAQVRLQGFACDKPLGARRDVKRSKPDHAVWLLRCSNATYRVSRAPDMAAKIAPLR